MALSTKGQELLRHVIVLHALNQLPPEAAKAVLSGDDSIDDLLQAHATELHRALHTKASGKSEAPSKGAPTYKRARDLFNSADEAAPDAEQAAPNAPSGRGPVGRYAARRQKINDWVKQK